MRGTFANIRIRNEMVPGVEGGFTKHQPSGEEMPVYDAAMKYAAEGVPLVIVGVRNMEQDLHAIGLPKALHCWGQGL